MTAGSGRRAPRPEPRPPMQVGELTVTAGRSGTGEIPIARQVTGTRISLPVQLAHGRRPGPTVWLSAAVHGDEVNGVEIIRRVMKKLQPRAMRGSVIAVPIVNVHGFLSGDRYLPDRRDLNRSFPGSATGSLAARIANLFMTEIAGRCTVGIDLHTGSDLRTNLPQIRADLDDPETRRLATAFDPPVILHSRLRDGSLRQAATERGATVLLYEGGEASRFDEEAIATGTRGVLRVLAELDIVSLNGAADRPAGDDVPPHRPLESRRSTWVRARRSGIALIEADIGSRVARGEQIGVIHDSVGVRLSRITAPRAGMIVGLTRRPLVNQGDAIAHIADIEPPRTPDQ